MNDLLGDYAAFFSLQVRRLAELGIAVTGYRVSHLAFRTETLAEYLEVRSGLEAHCAANVENVWNGRPISKILLERSLSLPGGQQCDLIELIPPPHQAEYRMGLEHVGFAVGDDFPRFERRFSNVFTGRQFQTDECQPYYVRFADNTNVKFYPRTLLEYCVSEGHSFDGIYHTAGGVDSA
ncbi:MAG: VOC family protein [Gammaproteobacteria bacterium]|nr:VOC family protein [Gammaproteobacteria bacterium]MDH4255288.1 VOC family protein [Gammaproteobacteria bacterium]MDH5310928.1 VOC family protein [Gammaproteobacteria bacterium]